MSVRQLPQRSECASLTDQHSGAGNPAQAAYHKKSQITHGAQPQNVAKNVLGKTRNNEEYQAGNYPRRLCYEMEFFQSILRDDPLHKWKTDDSRSSEGYDGNVIFLHLGRGVRKSIGAHRRGTTADEWIGMVSERLLV